MSITAPPGWGSFQPPPYPVRKFTVDEYHRLIQAGLLDEDERIELLEGWLVPKMGRNPPHDGTVNLVEEGLRALLPPGWIVRGQSAITLADSEPEPDVAVVAGTARDYMAHHPTPPEIALVVEVADSSLDHDRRDKGRIYARAGVPCYWIINLVDVQVEVYTDPTGPDAVPTYQQQQVYRPGDAVPLLLAGQTIGQIPVQDLLP